MNKNCYAPLSNDADKITSIWVPKSIKDLEYIKGNNMGEPEMPSNHIGLNDREYRQRRWQIGLIAKNHIYGQAICRVDYTNEEKITWSKVFKEVSALSQTHACLEYFDGFKILKENNIYIENDIPQLEDVSNFLKNRTGFSLIPVSGFLTFRDFFAGLAHKVFFCTQYIRHPKSIEFSPEPDICHELIGHLPLLLNPEFAQFLQEFGTATLGLPQECIDKLSNIFWFTVEVGLCQQNGLHKAYGGSIMSSFGELKRALELESNVKPFNIEEIIALPIDMTNFQKVYYSSPSLKETQQIIMSYMNSLPKPITTNNKEGQIKNTVRFVSC